MSASSRFDVAVVGLGPAGRALASRAAAQGLLVLAVDPRPDAVWSPTYGIWADELGDLPPSVIRSRVARPELRAHGVYRLPRDYLVLDNPALQAALPLDGVAVRRERLDDDGVAALRAEARVVVDARGARPDGIVPGDPSPAQTAFGIVVPADDAAPALQGATGLLMDWRTDWAGDEAGETPTFLYAIPLGDGTVLLEETCLAAAPGLPIPELKARLRRRLLARGMAEAAVDHPLEREVVRIPMRGRARPAPAGVLAAGTAGRGGNLVTGYSVAHSMARAGSLAAELAAGRAPRAVDARGPADVFREMGLRALLRLDVAGTLGLFDAFGRLPASAQRDFMSRDSTAPGLARAMWGMFVGMSACDRGRLIAATLGPPSLGQG
ncbi:MULTISPECIES: lycopene cyclase family protein [Tessaracoccus]|uniref:lycopene cyclase family protein n=1 Tax=Tessaracoccus TaxID=72763 RepID=UPI0018D7F013|nr:MULTISPECIES: lycopene cyclase family protein [Tessaracoccus]